MSATTPRRLAGAATTLACVAALLVAGATPAHAAPVNLAGANWIWYPDGDAATSVPAATRYLRRTFTAPSGVVSEAQLVVTGDDSVDVWLNGVPLASSAQVVDSWRQALHVDLASAVRPGANTLAIAARNTAAGPAGVLGRLRVVAAGGTVELVTDSAWKAATSVGPEWTDPATSDAAWPAARVTAGYGTGPWGSGVTGPDVAAGSPLAVTAPTTERRVTPLGIDAARPRFGWKATAPAGSELLQGAYQVVVSSTEAGTGDVWDSGRVVSGRSVDAVYGGPALASRTRYWWRARVWDTQGRLGAWGPTSWFETGQYDPANGWQAAFVGSSAAVPALTGASWIWYPEGDPGASAPIGTRYLRRVFTVPAGVTRATLTVTGDDTADVWVNGTQVSTSPRAYESWKSAAVVDVTARLVAGSNTIAIATENTTVSPAGLIAALDVTAGATTRLVTDASWKAGQSGPSGWQNAGFNDSAWPAARGIAAYGAGPWGSQVSVVRGAPYLRKGFTVSKPVASARLMVTALGLHETRINGAKVGVEALAPGWTDYNRRVQYRILDVTSAVRQGDNAIGAYLGNGWYSGSLGMGGNQRYGTQPWYSADLVVRHTDGTTTVVRTDASWKTAPSPIRFDDIFHGEEYDARGVRAGWDQPGYDDSGWAAVSVRGGAKPNLVSAVDPGVAVQATVPAVAVTQPRPGVFVVDLGQNFAGWNRLRVRGPAGTTVTMRHAEVLNPDGTPYFANLRAARATDRFTLAGTGADEVFEPRFTVHGYRYVELTGFPGTPTLSTVTGLAAWTNGAATGTFSTSHALVNQLQRNILWGQRSNMLTIPTDCPQRDERLGWTGDIAAFVGTSTFNMDVHGLLDKFTDDLTDAQRADGAFTDVAPAVCCGAGTAGWGDAGVIVPYTLWQRYGDLRIVDENFTAMRRWVDFSRATSGADLIRNQWTYGDWLNVNDNTAQDLISTAYFGYTARLVSRMAAATGRTAEAASYGALADQVAAAFTSRFVAADGTVSGNTQTGYVLALSFGLVPASRVQAVADKLAAKVASRSGHLSVGFLGVENLLPVLAENGHLATAYQVLLQPDYPGWGYMGARGGTTIWERWDGIRTDGSFQDPGMNSFNHYGLGSVGDFLYRTVGGVGPDPRDPGYHRLVIAPRPGGGLTSGRSDLATPYGRALSDWSVAGGVLTLRVEVPANTTATVRVPVASASVAVGAPAQAVAMGYAAGAAVFHLAAGSYTFTAPA
ncbi:family 78 glycoside hydrolase catalytic domain [Asanoa siamensis]|uniref:alpha-L-rhamnosidase n=1 Tax=Asanoa siamensis TaxID=926357 RepID=A0ABQ4D0R0_9ACTN|nr:family 78 glycoside hydrolase catalytic domain [Asanoa siamensis]GIF77130.1 rhamnosidase [Asanoa siamensis]